MSGESPEPRLSQLTAAATIGVDRAGHELSPERLLSHAALLTAQRRAGFRPSRIEPHLTLCPPDPRPPASAPSAATLLRLLSDPDPALIAEWATLALARGLRAPDAAVPALIDWWARQPRRDDRVFEVCGERGRWLAALNPAWSLPAVTTEIPADTDERWRTGTTPQRIALLAALRQTDPDRADALLQSTWGDEGADERLRFIEAIAETRSPADEPFLEAALDDRAKSVRRAAARALSLIPSSRLVARMNERAAAMITAERKRAILGGARVVLAPPDSFDKSWERDAIDDKPPQGVGLRAWLVRQVFAGADPAIWTSRTALTPDAVLAALRKDDFGTDATAGMIEAASRRGDPEWCAALQQHLLASQPTDATPIASLWSNLAAEAAAPLVLSALSHDRLTDDQRWALAASPDFPWPHAFSTAALKRLGKLTRTRPDAWALSDVIRRISERVAPEAADLFEEVIRALSPDKTPDSLDKCIDRVRTRADMHKEFAP